MRNALWMGLASLALWVPLLGGSATFNPRLATADEIAVETLALKIIASPEMKHQIEASTKAFASLPFTASAERQQTLAPTVNELAFAAALYAANSDPTRPKVALEFAAPHSWLGYLVPGCRWGSDNPDNVYLAIPIDGASKYEISVTTREPKPVQYSFLLYDSFMGENGKSANLDKPIASLRDQDIKIDADGSFKVTVDSAAANGRSNHVQSNANVKALMVRNTLGNWAKENPFDVNVKRLGPPSATAALSEDEIANRAANLLKAGTETIVGWQKTLSTMKPAPNSVARPFARGGGWGFATNGNFKLGDDEALVVTLNPLGAKYLGFVLTNPWMLTLEPVHASGSLNNHQAQANRDGSYTYVIALKDPGVYNWLDTGGLHAGGMLLRWQAMPETTRNADGAVQSVKLVKLRDLKTLLPEMKRVNAAQRRELIDQRVAEFARRYN